MEWSLKHFKMYTVQLLEEIKFQYYELRWNISFFTFDANPFRINNYVFDEESILISGNGSQVVHINNYMENFNVYQRTYVLCGFK